MRSPLFFWGGLFHDRLFWDGLSGCGVFVGRRRFDAFGFFLALGGGLGIFVVAVFDDVLHDEGDAAVGGVERGIRVTGTLIRESTDLSDLGRPDSVGLHNATSGVGAIGRKLPVAVGGGWCIGSGIGVTLDREFVG